VGARKVRKFSPYDTPLGGKGSEVRKDEGEGNPPVSSYAPHPSRGTPRRIQADCHPLVIPP